MPQRRGGAYWEHETDMYVGLCVFRGEACSCVCHTVGCDDDKTSLKSVWARFQLLVRMCERVSVRCVDTWRLFMGWSDLWLGIWGVLLMMVVVWLAVTAVLSRSASQFSHQRAGGLVWSSDTWSFPCALLRVNKDSTWMLLCCFFFFLFFFYVCCISLWARWVVWKRASRCVLAPPTERKDANCPTKRPLMYLRAHTRNNLTANTRLAAV